MQTATAQPRCEGALASLRGPLVEDAEIRVTLGYGRRVGCAARFAGVAGARDRVWPGNARRVELTSCGDGCDSRPLEGVDGPMRHSVGLRRNRVVTVLAGVAAAFVGGAGGGGGPGGGGRGGGGGPARGGVKGR